MVDDPNRRKRNKRRRRRKGPSGASHSAAGVPSYRVDPNHSNVPIPVRSDGSVDPFALFCALHLGIGPEDNYQPMGVPGIARRFGIDPRLVRESLREYCLDTDSLKKINYSLDMARVDARVVPDGISRTEVARMHWEEFLEAAKNERNWEAIMSVPLASPEEEEEVDELNADAADDEEETEEEDEETSDAQKTATKEKSSEEAPAEAAPKKRSSRGQKRKPKPPKDEKQGQQTSESAEAASEAKEAPSEATEAPSE